MIQLAQRDSFDLMVVEVQDQGRLIICICNKDFLFVLTVFADI